MIKTLALIPLLTMVTFTAYAKIIFHKEKLYLQNNGERKPLGLVNELIAGKAISKIKLYGGGDVRLLSFSKDGESEKLYSVDEKGFVYSIAPFTDYSVSKIHSGRRIEFKQIPGRKYKIDGNGFFLY